MPARHTETTNEQSQSSYGGDTQSRNLRQKLAQVSSTSFLTVCHDHHEGRRDWRQLQRAEQRRDEPTTTAHVPLQLVGQVEVVEFGRNLALSACRYREALSVIRRALSASRLQAGTSVDISVSDDLRSHDSSCHTSSCSSSSSSSSCVSLSHL